MHLCIMYIIEENVVDIATLSHETSNTVDRNAGLYICVIY